MLARTGNYEQASRKLHVTQPTLSRSIQSLEQSLDMRLIERQRGRAGLRLTIGGQELLRRSEQLLEIAGALEEELTNIKHAPQRELAFGIGPMLASTSLTEPLLQIMEAYPSTDVSVVIDQGEVMNQRLLNGSIEFYIAPFHRNAKVPGVERRRFGSRPPGILVRPGHPLVGQHSISSEMISRYPRISGTAWNDRLLYVDEELARHLHATVEIDNFELLVRTTLRSDAVLMFSARDRERELVPLDVDFDLAESPEISAFMLAGHPLSPAAALLIDLLKAAYVHRKGEPDAI